MARRRVLLISAKSLHLCSVLISKEVGGGIRCLLTCFCLILGSDICNLFAFQTFGAALSSPPYFGSKALYSIIHHSESCHPDPCRGRFWYTIKVHFGNLHIYEHACDKPESSHFGLGCPNNFEKMWTLVLVQHILTSKEKKPKFLKFQEDLDRSNDVICRELWWQWLLGNTVKPFNLASIKYSV